MEKRQMQAKNKEMSTARQRLTLGIVVPVHNCLDYTKKCIESVQSSYRYKWIIIDNGSTDDTQNYFEGSDEVQLHLGPGFDKCVEVIYHREDKNQGVAKSWNWGISTAFEQGCDVALVINNDLVFAPDTIDRLMDWYTGGHVLTVNNIGPFPERLMTYTRSRKAVPSMANFIGFLIDSNVTRRVGWFDEQFEQGYFEDDDYKRRCADEGVACFGCLDAVVAHFGSRTIKEGGVKNEPSFSQNRERFKEKWGYVPDYTPPESKPKLLWIGDAIRQTGFWRVGYNVLKRLDRDWDIHILGINYTGDPHPYAWPVYMAASGGDVWGVNRYVQLVGALKPDVICILNDPFIVVDFLAEHSKVGGRVCAYMPIDSKNYRHDWCQALNTLTRPITYTEFGRQELSRHGLERSFSVIPHGVDLQTYYPTNRHEARVKLGIEALDDWFIVGNVNANQPRKRLDLTIEYFAEWVHSRRLSNVALYLHCKTRGIGWDLHQLAVEYNIEDRLIMLSEDLLMSGAVTERNMRYVYGALDVQITTTLGEGWGLTTMEGMACGIPQIVPDWAGLGEWAKSAAEMIPCSNTYCVPGNMNNIGGIPDREKFLEALDLLYRDSNWRQITRSRGLDLVNRPVYRWDAIGAEFDRVFREVLDDRS